MLVLTSTPQFISTRTSKMSSVISSILSARAGVKKQQKLYKFSTFMTLVKDGKIKSDDWNREEVKKRPGDANDLMKSMAMGWSISMILGYWDGLGELAPTKENPIRITEGGHRYRWIKDIIENKALLDTISLNCLKDAHPEVYQAIMDYTIVVEITTHASGKVPETYVKGEYQAVNTKGSMLTAGETLRASTDTKFNELVKMLETSFTNRKVKMEKQPRDMALEVYAAIIRGITKGSDEMKKNKEILLSNNEISDEMFARASSVIKALGQLEATVYKDWARTNLEAKKFLEDKLTLEAYGPIIHALRSATEAEFPGIIESARKFFLVSLVDKETRKANMDRLKSAPKKGSNGGGRLNAARYAYGWGQLMAIITTSPVGDDATEDADTLEAE